MAVNFHAMHAALALFGGLSLLCAAPHATRAEPALDTDISPMDLRMDPAPEAARDWLRDSATKIEELWGSAWRKVRTETPDWLQRRSGSGSMQGKDRRASGDVCLAVQEDRPDGTELMTVRYQFDDLGALRTYAGAGINRAEYYDDGNEAVPRLLSKRAREDSIGAAAEVGAELQVSERMQLTADVRWAELDDRARVLRAEHGPVDANSLMLGVAIGYRFR